LQSIRGIVNFLQTAESGSFTAASAVLGISAVAVGKNVAALEAELGVRLFQRTTRQLQLTTEGRLLVEQCSSPMRDLEFAYKSVRQRAQSPNGLVRITSVTPFARGIVQPLLPMIAEQFPKIQVELTLDDKVVDMVADGFDIGIRVGQMSQPTLIARPIAALNFVVVGAPSYFRANGVPKDIDDLSKHKCVSSRATNQTEVQDQALSGVWRLGDIKKPTIVAVPASLLSNDVAVLLSCALQGQGLFYCPLPLVVPHLRRGELQVVLPQWSGHGLSAFLHYPSRRNLPARVKVLVDFMLKNLRDHDYLQPARMTELEGWMANTDER
jgi:DNA-binding transcriptional LysR family regulator